MKRDLGMIKIRRRCIARDLAEKTGGTKGDAALVAIETAAGCSGKERFGSFALASKVRDRKQSGPRMVYPCRDCGGFHIGNNSKRSEREGAR